MGIFRTNDPTQYNQVDGIVIDESAPPPSITGLPTNVVIMVGQFQRGPATLTDVGSTGFLNENYGVSTYSGNQALKNKKFGRLRLIRVVASDAVLATKTFQHSAENIIAFSAKQGKGLYGNSITVAISAGTNTGKKYIIKDTSAKAVLPTETYDNVTVATVVSSAVFAGSKLVTAAVIAVDNEPDNIAATPLALGSDGTVVDTDYQAAIALAEVEQSGNLIGVDVYNATRSGYLKVHVANTEDKMCVVCGPQVQDAATAEADAANFRDADGRIIYAYPWVETSLDGVLTMTQPASWALSLISQIAPNIDPAFVDNTQFLAGVTNLQYQLTRTDYINLRAAGICAFEFDSDIGFKIKSGVTTQIVNSSKVPILRRRMADFLTNSIGKGLKAYQNGINGKQQRTSAKGMISAFVTRNEQQGVLPKDSDVKSGKAKLIDTESLNTDDSVGNGFFYILYKQRIFSSMEFIVLKAEIGTTVVVTEQAA